MRPFFLLDLYCCAGGAAAGYHQAGFNVVGVDNVKRKNYPYRFVQADAIEYLLAHGHEFDAVHASPPCQLYSNSTSVAKSRGATYPDLLSPTRNALDAVGRPYVIENVIGAPMRADLILRGDLFGLKVIRRRQFEFGGWWLMQPQLPQLKLSVMAGSAVSVFGNGSWQSVGSTRRVKGFRPTWAKNTIRETWAHAMGIDHYMTCPEIAESIPPAYTKYIGSHLIQHLCAKTSMSFAAAS